MKPEVSVILPYYNAETTIKKAIESILVQSYSNFELLLVNNNSSDLSEILAQQLAKTDTRIVRLSEAKKGVPNAMNCGLTAARGNFIARMDADDIAHPKRLEKQLAFLKKNTGVGFVGSQVKYVPHHKNTAGFQHFVDWGNAFFTTNEIELNRFVEIPLVNPTIFFRRELFEKYGGCFDGGFPEDYEMQLRYLAAGVKMAKLQEQLVEWHDYPTRLTRTDERYSTEAFLKTKAIYFRKWSEQNNPKHPNIWVWGAGRKTRQRALWLKKNGLTINGYIDIKATKKNARYYKNIPDPGKIFIVSMVTNTGAGTKIREFLKTRSYQEGEHFILMG